MNSQIRTMDEAYRWCLVERKRVYLRCKKSAVLHEHSFKVIANMPFGAVNKVVKAGRLYRATKLEANDDKK